MLKRMLFIVIGVAVLMAKDPGYVGASKCKMCHNKAAKGAQFKNWLESGHANSFETLKTPQAQEIAKARGLKTSADKAPECVVCHTTGFGKGGYEIKDDTFWTQVSKSGSPSKEVKLMTNLQNVGCESCHGPGSLYKSKKIMVGITNGSIDGASKGLVMPEKSVCVVCHNSDSPTYQAFNFEERVKEIAHPYPQP